MSRKIIFIIRKEKIRNVRIDGTSVLRAGGQTGDLPQDGLLLVVPGSHTNRTHQYRSDEVLNLNPTWRRAAGG